MNAGINYKNILTMKDSELQSELDVAYQRMSHFGKNPQFYEYSLRAEQIQNELASRNIKEGAKSATTWSKWAIRIAIASLLVTLGFSIANFLSDKSSF